jgi:hypothetical protein
MYKGTIKASQFKGTAKNTVSRNGLAFIVPDVQFEKLLLL